MDHNSIALGVFLLIIFSTENVGEKWNRREMLNTLIRLIILPVKKVDQIELQGSEGNL
jgi:hypothetical protein